MQSMSTSRKPVHFRRAKEVEELEGRGVRPCTVLTKSFPLPLLVFTASELSAAYLSRE